MRFLFSASSIVGLAALLLLTGCESLGIPNHLARKDEVPADVRAQPRIVEVPPPVTDQTPWPRLGDVPPKPKDFSPKPVYDHYMNELEFQRGEAEDAKKKLQEDTDTATQIEQDAPVAPPLPFLSPPQLPQKE